MGIILRMLIGRWRFEIAKFPLKPKSGFTAAFWFGDYLAGRESRRN